MYSWSYFADAEYYLFSVPLAIFRNNYLIFLALLVTLLSVFHDTVFG